LYNFYHATLCVSPVFAVARCLSVGVRLSVCHVRVLYPGTRQLKPRAPQFWGFLSIYAYSLYRRTTKFEVVTHMRRGLVLGVSHAPTPRTLGPSASQFRSTLLFMRTLFVDVVTHVEEGRVFWGPPRLPSQGSGVPWLPNFVFFFFLLYLCLHPLTQNNQIRHGNIYGDGRVFTRSATPLHLHNCVARFVSEAEFLVTYFCEISMTMKSINHHALFVKLMKRKIPVHLL